MKKPRIWYVSKYAESSSDYPTRQYMFSKAFAAYGFDTTLIFSRSNGNYHNKIRGLKRVEYKDNVHCIVLNGPLISPGFNAKRILSWLLFEWHFLLYGLSVKKDQRPDIIIASSLSLITFFTAAILKKQFGCTLILEIRDIWPDTVIAAGKFSGRNIFVRILRRVEMFGYLRADGFVSSLPRFADYLKTRIKKDFKFEFVPQGFDQNNLCFDSEHKYKNEFYPGFMNVCYCGTIGEINCIDEIIACAKILKGEKIRFIIIGSGPSKTRLINECSALYNVIFLDPVTIKEIIPILSHADLLINPWKNFDIYKYGVSPNKWTDYLLSGRPMLISYSGYRGLISDAKCAFFTEADNTKLLAETILKISQMPLEQLKQMGEQGRKYALQNLSYDILGKKYLDFIIEIAGSKI